MVPFFTIHDIQPDAVDKGVVGVDVVEAVVVLVSLVVVGVDDNVVVEGSVVVVVVVVLVLVVDCVVVKMHARLMISCRTPVMLRSVLCGSRSVTSTCTEQTLRKKSTATHDGMETHSSWQAPGESRT
jgi:hypothetical protein